MFFILALIITTEIVKTETTFLSFFKLRIVTYVMNFLIAVPTSSLDWVI